MLRHEYVDHVAALVFAELAAASSRQGPLSRVGTETFAVLASFASRAAEVLAAVRYPEAREGTEFHDRTQAEAGCTCAGCVRYRKLHTAEGLGFGG